MLTWYHSQNENCLYFRQVLLLKVGHKELKTNFLIEKVSFVSLCKYAAYFNSILFYTTRYIFLELIHRCNAAYTSYTL